MCSICVCIRFSVCLLFSLHQRLLSSTLNLCPCLSQSFSPFHLAAYSVMHFSIVWAIFVCLTQTLFFFFFWKKAISKMLLLMQTAPFSCDTVRMFAFYVYLCKTCKHCDIVDVFFILFGANISESRTSYQDSFTFPRQTKISYCVRSITIRWYLCVRVAYAFLSLTESGVCS